MSELVKPILDATAPSVPAANEPGEIATCWNRIGVYGDNSCPELSRFIHCRNCGVFSNAAHRLLDRPLPEEYRREWTAHFALEKKRASPARLSAVVFRLDNEWLALPTAAFQEVAEHRRVHSLPHRRRTPALGLVNIRGELLICVSLERVLGLERRPARQGTAPASGRLLVASWEGSRLVFPVDEVQGIHRFQENELREPPATVAKSRPSFSEGIVIWREQPVGFLNPARLFKSLNQSLASPLPPEVA